jgi:mannitol/fructose-specific phosphotransferase system IIA component
MAANEGDSRERIGEFLVKIGAITEEQVQQVLARQKQEPNRLFGEIAIELGFIDDSAIERYIYGKPDAGQ